MAATNGGFQATDDVEASKVPNANEQATENSNNQTRRILEVDYRNTKQSAICSIIVFLALILILGAVVVVLVFLLDGQNGGPDREQQTELLRGPFIVSASITIVNLDYTEALSDADSRDFIDLDERFQSKLESVLSETSLKDTYRGVEITNFRSGSVIVDCLLLFCDPMATSNDVIQTLLDAFTSQTSPANAVDDDLILSNNNVNVEAASAQTTSIKLSCPATTQTTTMLMMSSTLGVTTTASFTPMVASPVPTSTPVLSSTSASTPMLSPTSTPALSSTPALEPTSTPVVSSSTSSSTSSSPGLSSSTPVSTATIEMSSVPQVSTQLMSSLTLTTSPVVSSQPTSSPTSLLSSASTTVAASATQTSVSAVSSAPPTSSATLASLPLSSTPTMTSETSPVRTSISPTSVPSMSSTITTTSSFVSSGRRISSLASSSSTSVSSPVMSSSFTPTSTPISTPQTVVSSSTMVTTTPTITSSPTLTLQPSSSAVSSSSLALQPSSSATPSSSVMPSSSATPPLPSSSVAGTSTSLTPSMHVSVLSSDSLKTMPTASLPYTSDDLSMTSSVHVAGMSPSSSNPTRTSFISPSESVTSRLVMPSKTILLVTSSQTVSFTAEASLASTQTINIPTEVTMVTTRLSPSQTAFTTSSASVASLLPSMQLTTSTPSSTPPAIAVNVTSPFTVSASFSAVQSSSSILSSVSNSLQTFPTTTQSQLNSQIVQTTSAVTMATISGSPSLDMSMTILSTPSLPVMMSSVAMTTTPTQETTTQLMKPSTEEQTSTLPTTGTVPGDTVTSSFPTIATCTQSLSVLENSTYFSSSDVINGATIDFECKWSYLSPVAGATIMVTFVTFDLGDDELKLQLGLDTTRSFTGSELPSPLTTDANRIDITLDTNSNTNVVDFVILLELILKDNVIPSITPPYTGTQLPPATFTTSLPGCDPTNAVLLTETSVKNITSPGYPRGYLNNLECEWIYTKIASDDLAIYLEFIAFDMAGEDYLEIETSGRDAQMLRYSGSVRPPPVRSYGMTMRFITDSMMTATGFAATVRLVSVTEPECIDVQEVLVPGVNKTVTTPGYPNGYSSNMDCTWTLMSSVTDALIVVTFVTFDIGDDSLNIQYSGMTFQFTGTNPPMPITTSDNSINIQFTSNDVNNQNPGFELVAHIFIPPEPTEATQEDPSTPSRQLTAVPDLSCTPSSSLLTVNAEPRTLTSPGYPGSNYAPNMDCSWSYILIDVSMTKTIQLHFNFFDVGDDRVIVDDEMQRTTYTGSATPPDIVSTSDRVTIKLITDSEDNHPGFEVIITVVDR